MSVNLSQFWYKYRGLSSISSSVWLRLLTIAVVHDSGSPRGPGFTLHELRRAPKLGENYGT